MVTVELLFPQVQMYDAELEEYIRSQETRA